jgi:hypothetical protein
MKTKVTLKKKRLPFDRQRPHAWNTNIEVSCITTLEGTIIRVRTIFFSSPFFILIINHHSIIILSQSTAVILYPPS